MSTIFLLLVAKLQRLQFYAGIRFSSVSGKRSTTRVKPAPDFKKLHKQFLQKLEQGKACTKKPCTVVCTEIIRHPFRLTIIWLKVWNVIKEVYLYRLIISLG